MNELCCNFMALENQCSAGSCSRYGSKPGNGGNSCKDIYYDEVSSLLSSSMTGTVINVDGQKIEDYFNDDVHILKYCLARMDEIFKINQQSYTPSAYGCILSFLSFLGMASSNATDKEGEHFKCYCNKHLLRLRCKRTERKESGAMPNERKTKTDKNGCLRTDVNTWGEVLYKLLRCGLVHALSSTGNREPNQNEIEIRLTHDPIPDAETYEFAMDNGNPTSVLKAGWKAVTLTINAFDLCEAVKDSILHIYTENSDVTNMREYFKKRPPLMAVVGKRK